MGFPGNKLKQPLSPGWLDDYTVILRRLAQAEFDDAADWYERRRAGRGAIFTAAIRQIITKIAAAPDAYPEVYGDVREAGVQGFPYAVYYRIEPNQITVLAVFHSSRDPSVWQSGIANRWHYGFYSRRCS